MKSPGQSKQKLGYNVNVLERAFKVLDAYSQNGQEPSVSELISKLRIPKSTVHRLINILERHGYLEHSPITRRYHLGSKLVELGMHALGKLDLGNTTTPHLQWLVEQTGETAHLGVLRGGEIISLFHAQGRHVLRPPSTVGRRIPAYCTSLGKAIIAFLPDEEANRLIDTFVYKPFTTKTITGAALLRAELKRVRGVGYALDNEEFEEGLKCMGAPIRDHSGRVIAAISIAMPSFRMKKKLIPELGRSVLKAARDLSKALGYCESQETHASRGSSQRRLAI
jgi:IclR family transcriptional regulator, KDG regulon repressor